jgi:hypothetical protein
MATGERQMSAEELEIRQRLKDDFEHYAMRCLRIRTKAGRIEPLTLNQAQRHVHERLEEQRRTAGKVRALVLKGRQMGISTYIGGRFYHRTTHARGHKTFIQTHEQGATNNLFKMVERYHEHCPELVRPATGASNAKELSFPFLDSGYTVGTAGSKAVGRSDTLQMFHGSEVAFWPNAQDHFAGVVQAVADEIGTEIILESTANGVGGEFHQRWQNAEAGIGDYVAIFVPWFWDEGYVREAADFEPSDDEIELLGLYGLTLGQLAWRRNKISELGDETLFKQEYPSSASEAFQMTGHDGFIAPADVVRARKNNISEGIGPLIIGVDPKREGTDRFSIAWRSGRKVSKVESDASPIETMAAASKLKDIIDRDNPERVFIDVGGNGAGIHDVIVSWDEKYRKIVRLVNFGSAPFNPPPRDKDGKEMAGYLNRRAEMWGLSRDWLKQEGGADIPDLDSLQTDACAPEYHYHPVSQKLVLESKEHMRSVRKVRSPDEWDAIALTFAEPVGKKTQPPKARQGHASGEGGWMR